MASARDGVYTHGAHRWRRTSGAPPARAAATAPRPWKVHFHHFSATQPSPRPHTTVARPVTRRRGWHGQCGCAAVPSDAPPRRQAAGTPMPRAPAHAPPPQQTHCCMGSTACEHLMPDLSACVTAAVAAATTAGQSARSACTSHSASSSVVSAGKCTRAAVMARTQSPCMPASCSVCTCSSTADWKPVYRSSAHAPNAYIQP